MLKLDGPIPIPKMSTISRFGINSFDLIAYSLQVLLNYLPGKDADVYLPRRPSHDNTHRIAPGIIYLGMNDENEDHKLA